MKIRIAILGSGSGTNAENIIRYFQGHSTMEVALVLSNRADAYILERARMYGIAYIAFTKTDFLSEESILPLLDENRIDFLVLAGFLLQIPEVLIQLYPNKIINIHPALLPKYGGKGMYGNRVHEEVVAAGEKFSGITIHYIDEHYDSGSIIFQTTCEVLPTDTPHDVAVKVHALEYQFYPQVIQETINKEFGLTPDIK